VAAGHGALLAVAVAAGLFGPGHGPGASLVAAALLGLAAWASTVAPGGALAFLAVPVWLLVLRGRGRGGPRGPAIPMAWTCLGLAGGLALGGHLLISAGLTRGYRVRSDGLGAWLAAVAYDVGANVPSGELAFRGVCFDRLARRAPRLAATAATTALYLVRYLIDPRLPLHVETIAGALVYLSLLSAINCWLYWRTGHLAPPLAAALGFFAAYRALGLP
jgi:membrane protease YdiL (CAAX protease family)